MKKLKIFCLMFIFICILVSAMGVSAEVFFVVDCGSNTVNKGEHLACDITTMWMNESLTSVSFDYETNFDVMFVKENNTEVSYSGGKANITLENFAMFTFEPVRIATMILSNDNITSNTATINFTNIKFNETISVQDVSKTISIDQGYVKDSICSLTSIMVDGAALQGFDPLKYEYDNIYINKNSVFLDATKKSDKSNVTGVGSVFIPTNETIKSVIRVTAENGDYQEYTLYITNRELPSDALAEEVESDNSLKKLELYSNNKKIDFQFEPGRTIYIVGLIDKDINNIKVVAELNNSSSSFVNGYGPRTVNINYGDNLIEMKVKSANGVIRTYSINISKDDTRSSDNSLSKIMVNDVEVLLKDSQLEYDVTLPHDVNNTKIVVETTDKLAKAQYKDISLHDGDNESVIIKVTAENGKERDYTINIYRLSTEENEKEFNNIRIDGYDIAFSKDVNTYDLNIDYSVTSLNIIVEPTDVKTNIIGNDNLSNGSVVTVQINDKEGTRNYIFNIHKAETRTGSDSIVLPIIVLVFGIISLGFLVIYLIKIKKRS